ncbi:MAG: hypothetical protein R3Y52_01250 [Psittacicella sp.]
MSDLTTQKKIKLIAGSYLLNNAKLNKTLRESEDNILFLLEKGLTKISIVHYINEIIPDSYPPINYTNFRQLCLRYKIKLPEITELLYPLNNWCKCLDLKNTANINNLFYIFYLAEQKGLMPEYFQNLLPKYKIPTNFKKAIYSYKKKNSKERFINSISNK